MNEKDFMTEQTPNNDSQNPNQDEKKKKRLIPILVIALAAVVAAGGAYHFLGNKDSGSGSGGTRSSYTIDDNTEYGDIDQMSQEEIQEMLNRKVEEGIITISMNTYPTFENGKSKGNLSIVNKLGDSALRLDGTEVSAVTDFDDYMEFKYAGNSYKIDYSSLRYMSRSPVSYESEDGEQTIIFNPNGYFVVDGKTGNYELGESSFSIDGEIFTGVESGGEISFTYNEEGFTIPYDDLSEAEDAVIINASSGNSIVFNPNGSFVYGRLIHYEFIHNMGNKYAQVVQIYLNDENGNVTDELVYESGLIPVNARVDYAPLSKPLSKGVYKATAYFNNVAELPDGDVEFLGKAGALIEITVQN